ncbi:pilus assembly protein [Bacillus sp. CGMCC 1.16607]|uniref:pilus assembly protein n=1 Tax=Bacillus sp. CGMCC 1.16607 TaxID=3351842 RepID=UPI003626B605
MKRRKQRWLNEKGSISIEFLGILPFFFLFFLILWQVVASGYSVFVAKTAVNNAAKIYAATNDITKAVDEAKESLGTNKIIVYKDLHTNYLGNGKFEMVLSTDHFLSFVPDKWKDKASMEIEQEAIGKVFVP